MFRKIMMFAKVGGVAQLIKRGICAMVKDDFGSGDQEVESTASGTFHPSESHGSSRSGGRVRPRHPFGDVTASAHDAAQAQHRHPEAAPMEVWIRPLRQSRLSLLVLPSGSSGLELKHCCCHGQGLPIADVYLKYNGKLVDEETELQHGGIYSLEQRLFGGKGGFGSMLRALGAQIEKTTNREACRDLSGRRLRDVNHEKA
ncbi:replication stress response regulator SDE2-like [Rhincodon typus]|uniref:replication stress response regulator SDE2-like n=1 Tax=Rhincodon typus TaxID=259920 RepID=UPI0020306C00|nr:replication stress response regulator SDE2-like [Rhincodon typus]